jgi:ribonuclease P protein component
MHGTLFSYLYGTIPGRASSGGAPVVSTKVAKSAAVRNRIKRRVRAVLKDCLAQVKSPIVIIVVAKKPAAMAQAAAMRDEITRYFEKAQ